MRALALALVVLLSFSLAPASLATPASPPWEFAGSRVEGSGAVGEPIALTVRVLANTDLDATIVLLTPAWVEVEGGPWDAKARAGEIVEHAWTLRPTREGFWAAVAKQADADLVGGGSCACAYGFAGAPEESRVATTPEGAIPAPELERGLTFRDEESATPSIERTVVPASSWLAHATLHVWITRGSTFICDECAMAVPFAANEARGPGSGPVRTTADAPGPDEAYTLWDEVLVAFDTAPDAQMPLTGSVQTGCENRRWGTDESWSCEVASREWAHVLSPLERAKRMVPAPAVATLALAVALALALRRNT